MYKYIHTCIYIHIQMSAYIHTYTYIYTHIQNVYINTRKHAWNDCAAANVQGAVADQGSFALLFRSTQLNHISHLQCKHFIVPTSCSTNTPPEVQQSRSTRACRNPSPRMVNVTVHEKRRVNEEQPTPASRPSRKSRQRGAQTTPAHLHWCKANPPSLWSTHVASSRVGCSEIGSHFHHFPAVSHPLPLSLCVQEL